MKSKTPAHKPKNQITALVANQAGEIFELNGYAAVGMAGQSLDPLSVEQTHSLHVQTHSLHH